MAPSTSASITGSRAGSAIPSACIRRMPRAERSTKDRRRASRSLRISGVNVPACSIRPIITALGRNASTNRTMARRIRSTGSRSGTYSACRSSVIVSTTCWATSVKTASLESK